MYIGDAAAATTPLVKLYEGRKDGGFLTCERPESRLSKAIDETGAQWYGNEVPAADQVLNITLTFVMDTVNAQNLVWGRAVSNTDMNAPSTGNHFSILLMHLDPTKPECYYIPECYPLKHYAINREKMRQQSFPLHLMMTDPNHYNVLFKQGTKADLITIMGSRSPF